MEIPAKIVSSGEETVKKSYQIKTDLILMDIGLKEMNGIEAAKKIKKLSIPIIYITGRYENRLIKESSHQTYLNKPLNYNLLQNEIQSTLKGCKNC